MSHKVQSEETTMLEEHSDCVEKALQENFPEAQILRNETTTIGGRGIKGAFVVRRKGQHDIALELKDGGYVAHMYEPGYGSGKSRIDAALRSTRVRYRELTADKFGRKSGMKRKGSAVETEIEIDGKKKKMMCITLVSGNTSSKKGKKGKVMY